MHNSLRAACVVACAVWQVAGVTVQANAQGSLQRSSSVLDGVVTDSALRPVESALVLLLGSNVSVTTGANGRFRIVHVPAGTHFVVVRRIGYEPASSAIEVGSNDTLRLSYVLLRSPRELEAVRISTPRAALAIREFEARRAGGGGQFIGQADIDKRNPRLTSDLFRSLVGVTVTSQLLNRRAGIARQCPMQFYVDGVAIPTPFIDRDLPLPREIAGIEVYQSTATAPLQYRSAASGFCGVVLVWTRVG